MLPSRKPGRLWRKFGVSPSRTTLLTAVAASVLAALLLWLPVGNALVGFSYDLLAALHPEPASTNCVVIRMDEAAHKALKQEYGRPWDRSLHARLLRRLAEDGARLVVFDVWFPESGDNSVDVDLSTAIRTSGNVILAGSESPDSRALLQVRQVHPPASAFAAGAAGWGTDSMWRDSDGTVRRLHPGTPQIPTLAWVAATRLNPALTTAKRFQDRWLNYSVAADGLPALSYPSALDAPPGYFRDRVVFIGGQPRTRLVAEETDEFRTPFSRLGGGYLAGVDVMAISFLNLQREDWWTRAPAWVEALILLACAGVGGFALPRLRRLPACAATFIGAAVLLSTAMLSAWWWEVWFPWGVFLVVQFPLTLLAALAVRQPTLRPQPLPQPEERWDLSAGASLPVSGSASEVAPPAASGYTSIRLIGQGGFGKVYLCRDCLGRLRAVKFVERGRFSSEEGFSREFRGVQKCGSLEHASLMPVLHFEVSRNGDYYCYVMALADDQVQGPVIDVQGPVIDVDSYTPRTLASELLKRGALPLLECFEMASVLVSGLVELHRRDLIHRDIKPPNIMYVGGRPRLGDFGLATDFNTQVSHAGTAGYVDPCRPCSPQGDLYSLGMVMYVAATGRKPEPFPRLPSDETGREQRGLFHLRRILDRACGRDIALRYASAREMSRDIDAALGDLRTP